MSRLVTGWIGSNFTLPHTIDKSLEHELADGSILLHIMHQLGHVSDDQFAEIRPRNPKDAGVAMANLALLAKVLKKVGISLRTRDVSDILAEEPGVAAAFVMKIKNMQEALAKGKKYTNLPPKYKEAIKSLRPRDFKRTTDRQTIKNTSSEELFYRDAAPMLYSGTFNQIDTMAQNADYDIHAYNVQKKIIRTEEEEQKAYAEKKRKVHDDIAAFELSQREANIKDAVKKKQDWLRSRVPEKDRKIRDLQFEMATLKIAELKQQRTRERLSADVIRSAQELEHSLSRQNLGGNEDGDIDISKVVKGEDGDAFLKRLERIVSSGLPGDSEIGDFMTQLKQRTSDKQRARVEKEKRRRRQATERSSRSDAASEGAQSSPIRSAQSIMASTYIPDDDDVDEDDDDVDEAKLACLLQERELQRANIAAAAEENVRVFAESFRMVADELSDDRRAAYDAVAAAQLARRDVKHAAAVAFCREVVVDLVAKTLDANTAGETMDAAASALLAGDFSALSDALVATLASSMDGHSCALSARDAATSEIWPGCVAVARSMGRFRRLRAPERTPAEDPAAAAAAPAAEEDPAAAAAAPAAEEDPAAAPAAEEDPAAAAAAPAADEDPAAAAPAADEVTALDDAAEDPAAVASRTQLVRRTTFMEDAQRIVGSLLDKCYSSSSSSSSSGRYSDLLSLTRDDRERLFKDVVGTPHVKTILILNACNGGISDLQAAANQFAHWVGPEAGLWDGTSSVAAAFRIKPLLEPEGKAKTPAVTFRALAEIFSFDYIRKGVFEGAFDDDSNFTAPDVPISTTAISVLKDMAESATRVVAAAANCKAGDVLSFTPSTIAMLTGQALWIRSYVHGQFIAASLPSPIPPLVISSLSFTNSSMSYGSTSAATIAHMVDWFARGGTRDGVPEALPLLDKAIAEESGKAVDAKGKAKAARGKGPPEPAPSPTSCIDGLVYVEGVAAAAPAAAAGSSAPERAMALIAAAAPSSEPEDAETFLAALNALPPSNVYMVKRITAVAAAAVQSTLPAMTFETDMAAAEVLLSVVNDALKAPIVHEPVDEGTKPDCTSSATSSTTRALLERLERRSRLSGADKVYLLHVLGVAALPSSHLHDLLSVQRALEASLESDVKHKALLVMCSALHLSSMERAALLRDETVVRTLKTVDPRWRSLCEDCVARSSNSKESDLDIVFAKDLICKLGDTIDARHVKWLQMLLRLQGECEDALSSLGEKMAALFCLSAEAALKGLANSIDAVNPLMELLGKAGYNEIPWHHDSLVDAARHMMLQIRRSDLRSTVFQIKESITQRIQKTGNSSVIKSTESGDSLWREFAVTDFASALPMTNSVHKALFLDCLQSSEGFLLAAREEIIAAQEDVKSSIEKIRATIFARHSYEHTTLRDWSAEMMNSSNKRDFVSRCHFGVSNESRFDSIAAMSGARQRVELSDMAAPLPFICALLASLPNYLSQLGSPSMSNITAATVQCIRELVRNTSSELQIPQSWRDPQKIEGLVSNFHSMSCAGIACLNENMINSAAFVANFVRNLAVHLICSSVPCAPPADYLKRLYRAAAAAAAAAAEASGKVDAPQPANPNPKVLDEETSPTVSSADNVIAASADEELAVVDTTPAIYSGSSAHVSIANFLKKMSADVVISKGWGGCDSASVEILLPACAYVCCLMAGAAAIDENSIFKVDDLVSLLLSDTPLLLSDSFEKRLLLEPSGGNSAETSGVESVLYKVPALLSSTHIYKAAVVSSAVVGDDNLQYSQVGFLRGPYLGAAQLDWLVKSTSADSEVLLLLALLPRLVADNAYTQYEMKSSIEESVAEEEDITPSSAADVEDSATADDANDCQVTESPAAPTPTIKDTAPTPTIKDTTPTLAVVTTVRTVPIVELLTAPEMWPLLNQGKVRRYPLRFK